MAAHRIWSGRSAPSPARWSSYASAPMTPSAGLAVWVRETECRGRAANPVWQGRGASRMGIASSMLAADPASGRSKARRVVTTANRSCPTTAPRSCPSRRMTVKQSPAVRGVLGVRAVFRVGRGPARADVAARLGVVQGEVVARYANRSCPTSAPGSCPSRRMTARQSPAVACWGYGRCSGSVGAGRSGRGRADRGRRRCGQRWPAVGRPGATSQAYGDVRAGEQYGGFAGGVPCAWCVGSEPSPSGLGCPGARYAHRRTGAAEPPSECVSHLRAECFLP